MTAFNLLQLALAVGALVLIVRRGLVLFWRAPVDGPLLREVVERALASGQLELAAQLAAACRPAWGARLAETAIAARREGRDAERALRELREEFEHASTQGVHAVLACGRMAPPLAFIGVILEISAAFSGGEGLLALQRGLAASVGLERALLTFTIGLSTSLVCFSAARLLRRQGRVLRDDLDRLVRTFLPLDPNRGAV